MISVEIITDAEYANSISLLTNTPTQAEFQLHNLKQAAWDTGFNENANKTVS